jgi:hypothetical protein
VIAGRLVIAPDEFRVTVGWVNVSTGVPVLVMVYELIAPGHVTEAVPE